MNMSTAPRYTVLLLYLEYTRGNHRSIQRVFKIDNSDYNYTTPSEEYRLQFNIAAGGFKILITEVIR